jgi:hypothetical protein
MTFRWLLRAAEWLDKRFPPKVVVTQEMYDALQAKEHRHSKELASVQGELMVLKERCGAQEKSLAALKDGIVKGQVPLSSSEKARLRDEFVRGDWGRPQAEPTGATK